MTTAPILSAESRCSLLYALALAHLEQERLTGKESPAPTEEVSADEPTKKSKPNRKVKQPKQGV